MADSEIVENITVVGFVFLWNFCRYRERVEFEANKFIYLFSLQVRVERGCM